MAAGACRTCCSSPPCASSRPAAIALVPGGGSPLAFLGLFLFSIANFAYQAALIYYDSTLPIVSKPESRGRVSGIGVAVGYLGTILIAVLILVTDSGSRPLTFLMAAVLFARIRRADLPRRPRAEGVGLPVQGRRRARLVERSWPRRSATLARCRGCCASWSHGSSTRTR